MSSKPTVAFALSIVGGVFVLIGAEAMRVIGNFLSFLPFAGTASNTISLLGDIGLLSGVLMLVGSIMMYLKPGHHGIWGALVLVGSIVSWIGAFGGVVMGFVLGLVGGILGIAWKPSGLDANVTMRNVTSLSSQRQQTVTQQQQGGSFCSSCGSPLPSGARVCNACGAPA
jgi:hypothetical protein